MEVKEALLTRRSVRKFTDEPVSAEDMNEILHAAMSGPSANNCMPWEFYVVTNKEAVEKLKKAAKYANIPAHTAIVVCGNKQRFINGFEEFWVQDASAAVMALMLRATELGLGTVWCGVHPMKEAEANVVKALDLPENMVPLNILYIGHPDQFPEARDQYREEFVHFVK